MVGESRCGKLIRWSRVRAPPRSLFFLSIRRRGRFFTSRPTPSGNGRHVGRHARQQLGQPRSRGSCATRKFRHLGEIELRVRKWQLAFGIRCRCKQRVRPLLLLDFDPTSLEQFELTIEGPQPNAELTENGVSTPRYFGKEHHKAMQPRGTTQRDVDARPSSSVVRSFHSRNPFSMR